jgi:ubiquinone/menaquinone biosynthesis C-methylase UbiE
MEESTSAVAAEAPELEFTGERIVPGKTAEALFREHEVRYLFAGQYVAGRDVLDVACGTGVGTAFLRQAGARSAWGLDIDPEAITYAKARYRDCEFAQSDATDLCLPDNSVDVVVSFETLEHLKDQEKFLKECRRVLRPGGIFLCSTPNTTIYRLVGVNQYHVHELTTKQFENMLAAQFGELRLFSQGEQVYPIFLLKRIVSHVLDRLNLKEAIKRILGMKAPYPCMRNVFSAAGGATCEVQPYRGAWLIQPTYLVAVGRKSCMDGGVNRLGTSHKP